MAKRTIKNVKARSLTTLRARVQKGRDEGYERVSGILSDDQGNMIVTMALKTQGVK